MNASDRIGEWLGNLPVLGWVFDYMWTFSDGYWNDIQRKANQQNQASCNFLDEYREYIEKKQK